MYKNIKCWHISMILWADTSISHEAFTEAPTTQQASDARPPNQSNSQVDPVIRQMKPMKDGKKFELMCNFVASVPRGDSFHKVPGASTTFAFWSVSVQKVRKCDENNLSNLCLSLYSTTEHRLAERKHREKAL